MIVASPIIVYDAEKKHFRYGPGEHVLTPEDHWLARIEQLGIEDPGLETKMLLPGAFLKGPYTGDAFLYFANDLAAFRTIAFLYKATTRRWKAQGPAWPIISLRVASYYIYSQRTNVHRPRFDVVGWRPIGGGGGPRKRRPRPVLPVLEAA